MGGHHHDHSSKNIRVAFFLNFLFAIIELIGGWWTNSMAIMSDAIHDLGDSLSLGAAWYFQRVSKKDRDKDFTYGYQRFTVLGAILNAMILTVGSVLILTEALPRLFDPVMPDATGMLYLSIFGILVNGVAAYRMFRGRSMNEKVVYLHLLEDVLGWLATLIVAITLQFHALPILDPLLSMLIAAFILYNVIKNLRQSVNIILQGTPEAVQTEKIVERLKDFEEIRDIHDCRVWTMDGSYHVLSLHVVLKQEKTMDELADIKLAVKQKIQEFDINHITLEFELEEEECEPS